MGIFVVIIGCDDGPHREERHISRSCAALAVRGNDVIAAINTVDNTYVGPESIMDFPSLIREAALNIYDSFGNLRRTHSFSTGYPFSFQIINGVLPLSGGRLLVVGQCNGLMSAVIDSQGHFEQAHLWNVETDIYWLKCAPAVNGMACVYESYQGSTWGNYLALFSENGELISQPFFLGQSAGDFPNLLVFSSGNAVILQGYVVEEYNSAGELVWSTASDSIWYGAAGEDVNGQLILFGTLTLVSPNHDLFIATRANDSLDIRHFELDEEIQGVFTATLGTDSSWFVSCVLRSTGSGTIRLLRYDGSDSATVTDMWAPDGDPYPNCATSSEAGGSVIGGFILHGSYDNPAIIRAYNSAGIATWTQILGE